MRRTGPLEEPGVSGHPDPASGQSHGAALRKLFEEHNRALHSFLLMKLGGNDQEAREIAQEAYARLLQLHEPAAISVLSAYLFKTAANIVVDRARQRGARARLDQKLADEEPVDEASPDRHVLGAEALAIVERALHELPPKYRRAFILHRFEEWSMEQIARDLGVQPRMARNYISRTAIYCKLRLDGISPDEARDEVMP